VIGIDREARASCPEVLFQPRMLGEDHIAFGSEGLSDLAYSSGREVG
jgi:hypothetical protein